METWKNKKVVYFKWMEYIGFYPYKTGIILEETDTECLVKLGRWKKVWVFKERDIKLAEKIVGFCKLLI